MSSVQARLSAPHITLVSTAARLTPNQLVRVRILRVMPLYFRWFIVGGKVISGSMYLCRGQFRKERIVDRELIKEAQIFADKWIPSLCCVMDLALVDNELKVVEFNCINSSGFYDTDIEAVFKSLYDFCVKM